VRPPGFWAKPAPTWVARALSPVSFVWGLVAAYRMSLTGKDCGAPVICVGNFVAGGAGKTPVAIGIGQRLAQRGERPAFLSRGYGGKPRLVPLMVDPSIHTASDVGDEPLLLARTAPTFVCVDRIAGAKAALAAGATVLIMDDGLQNPSLDKRLSLAVIDAGAGIGNGECVPAGPLRAPWKAQLPRVDAIILVGEGEFATDIFQRAQVAGKSLIRAKLQPHGREKKLLRGARVVAFAGIGRPSKFFSTLDEIGAVIIKRRVFPDHHAYTPTDIAELERAAASNDAVLVTTEKDAVRLPSQMIFETVAVAIEFEDEGLLMALLDRALAATL
jgi:tetraacyldisaccharide 4'-kinase